MLYNNIRIYFVLSQFIKRFIWSTSCSSLALSDPQLHVANKAIYAEVWSLFTHCFHWYNKTNGYEPKKCWGTSPGKDVHRLCGAGMRHRFGPGIDLAQVSQQVPNSPKHSSGNKTSHSQQGIWLWPPFFSVNLQYAHRPFLDSWPPSQAMAELCTAIDGTIRFLMKHGKKNDVLNRNFRKSSYATISDFIVSTYMSDILPKDFIFWK